ncbi:hypothetical protein SMICM304S_02803 [Streptomyces microflavus]
MERGEAAAAVHADPQRAHEPGEDPAAALVDLEGHQVRGHLHHVRPRPEQAQRPRGLQPQQSAADDDTGLPGAHSGTERVEVLDRAVGEAAGEVPARHGRYERA